MNTIEFFAYISLARSGSFIFRIDKSICFQLIPKQKLGQKTIPLVIENPFKLAELKLIGMNVSYVICMIFFLNRKQHIQNIEKYSFYNWIPLFIGHLVIFWRKIKIKNRQEFFEYSDHFTEKFLYCFMNPYKYLNINIIGIIFQGNL